MVDKEGGGVNLKFVHKPFKCWAHKKCSYSPITLEFVLGEQMAFSVHVIENM